MQNEIQTIKYLPITIDFIEQRIKWLTDPKINQFLSTTVRSETTREFHEKWFKDYLLDEKEGKKKIFIILVDDKPIGQVGLLEIHKYDKNTELYIMIGEKDYWGKGIAKAAIEYIKEYAFKNLALHKINLYVHFENKRAIALYEKTGFRHVGISRENIFQDGKYEDEVIMEYIKG